ncbi:MAG: Ig-like domain-containing protein [Gemmatimonadaceae bacterium]
MPRLAVVLATSLAGACADDRTAPSPIPAELELVAPDPLAGIAGYPAADMLTVRVLDQDDRPMPDVAVDFAVTDGGGSFEPTTQRTNAIGEARVAWLLGEGETHTARASVRSGDGGPAPTGPEALSLELQAVTVQVTETAAPMLGHLQDQIGSFRNRLAASLPFNQLLRDDIEAKLAMLNTPGLGSAIILDRSFIERIMAGRDKPIPIVGVFPLERIRTEADIAVGHLEANLQVLESFVGAWRAPTVQLWYGFTIGSSGGGGRVNIEERATFTARGVALPHEALFGHELSHSYVANETLTQFLELYVYNVRVTGSQKLDDWAWTRGYTGTDDDNVDVHVLLDIYALIGPDAMSAGYRAILPFHPLYGGALSIEAIQAFAEVVPVEHRAAVEAKLSRIRS